MQKFNTSIKKKVLVFSLSFTLLMGIIVAGMSYYTFYHYNKDNLINATEINVEFIADTINSNIENIHSLIRWCQINTRVAEFTLYGDNSNTSKLSVYERLAEQVSSNYSQKYMQRIIISNFTDDYLQIVPTAYSTAADIPKIASSLDYFDATLNSKFYDYSMGIVKDPFTNLDSYVVPAIRPIYHPYNSSITGYIFVEISVDTFRDAIKTYSVDSDSSFYLTIGNNIYEYNKGVLVLQTEPLWDSKEVKKNLLYSDTTITSSLTDSHTLYVTRPLCMTDCYITQSIPSNTLFTQTSTILYIIIIVFILVILAGIGFTYYLNHLVNRPVKKLVHRMNEISIGNFAKDSSIEWNNEFGDIGRGINSLSENVQLLMEKRIENENEKRRYEYQMLQSQINPHFIYNTLNSIKWMASIQNATGIPEMTTALSRLLKNISKGTTQTISIRSELDLLKEYMTIQQYRYGGSISMNIDVDDEQIYDCEIIRFTLQPIVENAIFHGIEPKGCAGSINVHAYIENNATICIDILDDGIGMNQATLDSLLIDNSNNNKSNFFKEIGISNVHKRIQFEYGDEYGLFFKSELGKYTLATVKLPFKLNLNN